MLSSNTSKVNLKKLPSPWLNNINLLKPHRFIRWETSRGCVYRCSFCQHRNPENIPKISYYSLKRIYEEIDLFCNSKVRDIAVLDSIFNYDNVRAIKILNRFVENNYVGKLSLQVRGELITNEFLDVVNKLDIRLELGLQTIHKNEMTVIRRYNNVEKFSDLIQNLNKRNIDYEVSLIYGLPLQTLNSFRETINWCYEQGVKNIKAFPLLLLRGTEIFEYRDKYNFIDDNTPYSMVQASNTFTINDWIIMKDIADNLNNNNLDKRLRIIN